MNTLVIGSGGREHALVKAISESKKLSKLYAAPGSSAIFKRAEDLKVSLNDFEALAEKILAEKIELVVVGPEAPLVDGLSDFLRDKGVAVFGPDQNGAMLEGDKVFAKDFMNEFSIPTGGFLKVSNTESLKKALDEMSDLPFYVFKYKDLAGGKGVLVSSDRQEVLSFAKDFGVTDQQTETVGYLEEPLEGWELSCICVVNESGYKICPILQDHKRLKDFDKGPNTGGMGVAGPIHLDASLEKEIIEKIVEPTVNGFKSRGMLYRGVIYIGVMVTQNGPKVLEYNVRFGDPEAQLIFPLVEEDWLETLYKVSKGESFSLEHKKSYACCVVAAAEGYPEKPVKGVEIKGLDDLTDNEVYHAGTLYKEGAWLVNGGRVLNFYALAETLSEAKKKAYALLEKVTWSGQQSRSDIGDKLEV